jgi:hypothetical protein
VARRVFLHVGSPKTGTTFLQQVLWSQRDLARGQGLLLPLDGFFDHYLATQEVRGIEPQPADAERAKDVWARIVEESQSWAGNVLVSHELFAPATAAQAERAIGAFGQDTEVHLVLTVRDLVRQIPAEWQEHVKHRSTARFDDFVDDLRREDPKTWFWRVQNSPAVLRRWGRTLPREHVHVVTVPPAGRPMNLLWDRFAGLLGIDPSPFTTTGLRANTSLGYEQAELLRQVNVELGERLPMPGPYAPDVKNVFAEQILSRQPGARLALAGERLDYAVKRTEQLADELSQLGVDVVGDLDELVPDPEQPEHVQPLVEPSDEVLRRVGVAALAGLLDEYSGLRRRAQQERQELHHLREFEREVQARPVRHALHVASERWAWAGKARAAFRRTRRLLAPGRDGR